MTTGSAGTLDRPVLPREGVADRLALLERTAVHLAGEVREATGWSAAQRQQALAGVDRVITLLSTARGDVIVAEQEAGTWRGAGDPSFEAWRGRTSRVGAGEVRREVRRAETATHLPAMRTAVAEGAATTAHLDALATVVHRATPSVREALAAPEAQAELVDAARRLDANAFGTAAARLAARLDPVSHERSHQAQRATRFLHLTDAPDGTRLSGQLDRMTGHRLRLALEAVSPRPALDDERTAEQRRADALGTLAEKVLTDPETLSGASVRPHVSFLMTAETWAGLRALGQARATTSGEASGGPALQDAIPTSPAFDPVTSFDPVTLDDGTPVPLSEVARVLCDCELTRIVTDADSAPLDLGRTQRTYTGVQRRAVVARDRGCTWNDCPAHARWCEVHHMRWWDRDGGATSVENGVLLCSFHHHETHRRDLTIERLQPRAARDGHTDVGVQYVFRDPHGRVANAPHDHERPAPALGERSAPAAPPARPPTHPGSVRSAPSRASSPAGGGDVRRARSPGMASGERSGPMLWDDGG